MAKPIGVSQLNNYIKRILQTDPILGSVSVIGEISNLKFHSSGHVYFSLKDEGSRVNCFLPADRLAQLACDLREGMEVIAEGYIYLYMRGGSYSLNVRTIEESGQGDLAAAFEKLKQKLQAEGLFDNDRKKPLPAFPSRIAVVTSSTGAAVRDILKIITSKNDYVDILIYPVKVQGEGAAAEIAAAVDALNADHEDVDLMIVGRGGGSAEELWAFNEEIVARAIAASRIPVISAVGHEIDFTIADFVADVRAETPTAAAERAVPDTKQLAEYMKGLAGEMTEKLQRIAGEKRRRLEAFEPLTIGRELRSRMAYDRLAADNMMTEMRNRMSALTAERRHRLELAGEMIRAADPDAILRRGYSIVTDESENIVRDAALLKEGQLISIRAARGSARARVVRNDGKGVHDD